MKLLFILTVFAVLAIVVVAWEKEDHEIFDLVSEIQASEGKGTTFYSWLDVPSTASTTEIVKAYRRLSMQLHPDKNPGVKGIHERFARLGVVSSILRKPESRQRYDFFYKNGVPKWRGTGYYYTRFRPGLGSVLAFLTILSSGLQLLVQRMNYTRDLQRIERFRGEAKSAAWGPKLIPSEGQRKVKINLGQERSGNTKWLDMVVEGQNVHILDSKSGEKYLLDSSSVVWPTVSNTWFLVLIKSIYRKVTKSTKKDTDRSSGLSDADTEDDDQSSLTESDAPPNGTSKEKGMGVRAPAVKAGGKRRKTTKRR